MFFYDLTATVFEKIADKLEKFVTTHTAEPPLCKDFSVQSTATVFEKVADELEKFVTAHNTVPPYVNFPLGIFIL